MNRRVNVLSSLGIAAALTVGLTQTACRPAGNKTPTSQLLATESSVVAALVGSQPITMGDIDRLAAKDLYEVRERTLENLITDRVLGDAAKQAGQSIDDFLRKQAEARVPNITLAEAQEFYDKNRANIPQLQYKSLDEEKDMPGGTAQPDGTPKVRYKPFDEVKDMIIQAVTGQKRQQAVGSLIDEMKKKAGVKVLMRPPKQEVAAIGPAKGPATAKVTIVEFSDFQCPYCSRGKAVIDQVVKKYGDKVRVVFRDFPLNFHDKAQKAAEAGQCANDQGKFWAMHDWMFDNQQTLDIETLKSAARNLGIDSAKFDQCLSSGQHAEDVRKSLADGQKVGVSGTPAFFINGVMMSGALPFEKFQAEIDQALEAAK